MNKVLCFVLVLFVLKNNAQVYIPFPTDSAIWLTKRTCQVAVCPITTQSFNSVLQLRDTTINGLVYNKIYNYNNNQLNSFYRESNKKIYSKYPLGGVFGNDTSEFVLYDFNMQIGDSLNVKIPSNWISVGGPISTQPKIYLSATSTISVNSVIHKTFSFTSNNFGGCFGMFNWIEGIGSDAGIFYNLNYYDWASCISYPAPYNFSLSCYFKNSVLIYNNNCTITSLPVSILSNKLTLSISPNPTNGILNITDEENKLQNATMQISNYIGQVVYTNSFANQIDMSHLSSGMYFVTIQDKTHIKTVKIVKE